MKRVPSAWGQHNGIGEKPAVVILYTSYIYHHVGTPKQKQTISY